MKYLLLSLLTLTLLTTLSCTNATQPSENTDRFLSNLIELATMRDEETGEFAMGHAILEGLFQNTEQKVVFVSPQIVSYKIEKTDYSGGAHGSRLITVASINRKTGKKITLADIAPGEKLSELHQLIKDMLVQQFKAKDYAELLQQLLEEPKPTENFYLDKDGFHFIYNEYEIACYAMGTIEVIIPFHDWPIKN